MSQNLSRAKGLREGHAVLVTGLADAHGELAGGAGEADGIEPIGVFGVATIDRIEGALGVGVHAKALSGHERLLGDEDGVGVGDVDESLLGGELILELVVEGVLGSHGLCLGGADELEDDTGFGTKQLDGRGGTLDLHTSLPGEQAALVDGVGAFCHVDHGIELSGVEQAPAAIVVGIDGATRSANLGEAPDDDLAAMRGVTHAAESIVFPLEVLAGDIDDGERDFIARAAIDELHDAAGVVAVDGVDATTNVGVGVLRFHVDRASGRVCAVVEIGQSNLRHLQPTPPDLHIEWPLTRDDAKPTVGCVPGEPWCLHGVATGGLWCLHGEHGTSPLCTVRPFSTVRPSSLHSVPRSARRHHLDAKRGCPGPRRDPGI